MSTQQRGRYAAGEDIKIEFSLPVRSAIRDLEASVHFSDHFDTGVREILNEWSQRKAITVHQFVVAFPAIAEETFRHIHATTDSRAQEAWDALRAQLSERGFAIALTRSSGR